MHNVAAERALARGATEQSLPKQDASVEIAPPPIPQAERGPSALWKKTGAALACGAAGGVLGAGAFYFCGFPLTDLHLVGIALGSAASSAIATALFYRPVTARVVRFMDHLSREGLYARLTGAAGAPRTTLAQKRQIAEIARHNGWAADFLGRLQRDVLERSAPVEITSAADAFACFEDSGARLLEACVLKCHGDSLQSARYALLLQALLRCDSSASWQTLAQIDTLNCDRATRHDLSFGHLDFSEGPWNGRQVAWIWNHGGSVPAHCLPLGRCTEFALTAVGREAAVTALLQRLLALTPQETPAALRDVDALGIRDQAVRHLIEALQLATEKNQMIALSNVLAAFGEGAIGIITAWLGQAEQRQLNTTAIGCYVRALGIKSGKAALALGKRYLN